MVVEVMGPYLKVRSKLLNRRGRSTHYKVRTSPVSMFERK